MRRVIFLCVLFVCVSCQSGEEDGLTIGCPTLAGELPSFQPPLDLYLDPNDSSGRVGLIVNGLLVYSDSSLSPMLPSVFSLHLNTTNTTLYTALSAWSLDNTVAQCGLTNPSLETIRPGIESMISVSLTCIAVGSLNIQLCVTVGTESFTALNGSYTTYTINVALMCETAQPPVQCAVSSPDTVVPVEFCATRNQTKQLVLSGANSWGIFITAFGGDDGRGYCLIDASIEGGLNEAFINDDISRNLPIPEVFPGLEMYLDTSRNVATETFSYSFGIQVENSSVLADPFIAPPHLPMGTSTQRLTIFVELPCVSPGFTKVTVNMNTSGLVKEILYRRDFYVSFYRNCTPDPNATLVVIQTNNNLGVQIGVPVAFILVTVVTVLVVMVTVMVHLTRRHKHMSYMMEQQVELDLLSSSNAYVSSNFKDPFDFLDEYAIEYNFASLEVLGSLGEGAFGRVFKAKAPGLSRGDYTTPEYVAVKTLKENSGADMLESFKSEVKVCVRFDHPNVIRLLGVCTKASQKCMIFEYMDVGGLGDLLRQSDPSSPDYTDTDNVLITPDHFLYTVVQIAHGLDYLAGLKFVHRDVATRNCLVDHNLNVKIADFGMSRETNAMDYYRIGSAKAYLPVRWMPPEALLYGKFTVKSDVWSFGVLMWEVYTYGHQPYSGLSNYEVIDRVKTGQILDCPDLCPAPIYDIIKSTWTRAPSKRPAMSVILGRMLHLLKAHMLSGDGTTGGEGYLNMAFGTVVSSEDLEEKKRVDVILEGLEEKANSVLEDQHDDDGCHNNDGNDN